ncbi:late embryogenesis abundant protein At5g17165 isoform X1 [Dendrobium catenatum]|uniref:Uncharacterized protein n=2 Tax=Dendrobium TaxID=37818 RepID=A0A8T3AVX0_DENNO|nr:late embryogenesis abundant protein At5g17165 isoform X1 [Dendrobium catenatum]KAI0500623.1 hypothetical protein KFK09_018837 [Dendrobium nobile]PKU75193.1 hypothetical protein MA16_Dca026914 [Dendrobium catenatum]
MAATSSKGRAIAESFGKRLANQIWAGKPRDPSPFSIARRASHSSSHYDKEVEEHVRPAVVPDHVINASSDKYWGPHPTTGVFGPADLNGAAGLRHLPAAGNGGSSALDQTVRFRPLDLEDLDKSQNV